MTASAISPFPFKSLVSYTKSQVLLVNLLARGIDARKTAKVSKVLFESMLRWFPEGIKITNVSVDIPDSDQQLESVDQFVGAELMHPDSHTSLYLFIDKSLAMICSQALLGQNQSKGFVDQNLSPLTMGVYEYMLLTLLLDWNTKFTYLDLKLNQLLKQGEDDWASSGASSWVRIKFSVHLGSHKEVGFVLLPLRVLDWLSSHEASRFEEDVLKKFAHLRTLLWAQVGSVTLSQDDVASLQKGDVIMLDQTLTHFDGKKLSGPIEVSVADGRAVFVGDLNEGSDLKINVQQFYVKETL